MSGHLDCCVPTTSSQKRRHKSLGANLMTPEFSVIHCALHPTCSSWRKAILQEDDSCDSLRRGRSPWSVGPLSLDLIQKYTKIFGFSTLSKYIWNILKLLSSLSSNMIIQFPNSDDSTISGPVVAKIGAGWWHLANEYEAADPARKARMRGLETGIGNHRWYGDILI